MTTTAAAYAEQIAADVIAQLAAFNAATPLIVPDYQAAYDRMYVINLESMTPAGDPTSKMQLVLAPVGTEYERTGWGAARVTVTLGMLLTTVVETADGVVTDPNIGAYEQLVDELCLFLLGPRTFAGGWTARDPLPVFGDHYNDQLYEKSRFHVPVLVDFIADMGVS